MSEAQCLFDLFSILKSTSSSILMYNDVLSTGIYVLFSGQDNPIWDARASPSRACKLTTQAHDADVNAISWNRSVLTY